MGKITRFTAKHLLILMLFFTAVSNAQIVNIPDANLKTFLLTYHNAQNGGGSDISVDANQDGVITTTEALAVNYLIIPSAGITDLTGMNAFTNLVSLSCSNNSITTLNASVFTHLRYLNCYSNNLTSLNVNGLIDLEELYCKFNSLTSLNLTGLVNLQRLECESNPLASLNLNGLTNLHILYYGNPELAPVDFSQAPNIYTLYCYYISQTSIGLNSLSQLYQANFYSTNLVSIDLSNSPGLVGFGAQDSANLKFINLKDGTFNGINCGISGNPSLLHVCTNDAETESVLEQINSAENCCNNPNVVVNSYCSFTPGGNYNTITGTVKYDANNNGCDAADATYPYLKVNINDGSGNGSSILNAAGNYKFYVPAGNYTVMPSLEMPDYFTVSPISAVVNFPLDNDSVATQNFCLTANGTLPDLEIILAPLNNAIPGMDAQYKLIYKNKGNQLASGTISLTFDDTHSDLLTAIPAADNIVPGNLMWNFSNLQPFETRVIYFTLNINSPLENPAVNAGDLLNFTAAANNPQGEQTLADNIFELHQTVANSLDPNTKTCLEGNAVTPDNIGKYLHYNINFENIGTEAATNIVVKDTIDTTKFDINSFQLLYASHPVETKITGNVVEFIFENINLPSSILNPIGGHGNVLFKIKTLPTLVVGNEVANTANIFFDYNAPIATNEARTAFTILSNGNFTKDSSIAIYPNPAKSNISISAKSNIQSVRLFDAQGRILQAVIENKTTVTLDISSYRNGIYFLRVTTKDGTNTEKIIKE